MATVLDRLRALSEEDACQLMRNGQGVPMSRQYLWQIRYGTGASARKMSLRLFARAVYRLGIGEADCPIRASLEQAFPDEFRPVKRRTLRRESSPRGKAS